MTCTVCDKVYRRRDHFEKHVATHVNHDARVNDEEYDFLPTMADVDSVSVDEDDNEPISMDEFPQTNIVEMHNEHLNIATVEDDNASNASEEHHEDILSDTGGSVQMQSPDTTLTAETREDMSPPTRRFRSPIPPTPLIPPSTPGSNSATTVSGPLTPSTRQMKSRLARKISDTVAELPELDQIEVMDLAIRRLNLKGYFRVRKVQDTGRKLTHLRIRSDCWSFWHRESTPSTLTTQKAKLRVSAKPRLHTGLSFVDTYSVIQQRNRNFYENLWYTTTLTFRDLFQKYLAENPLSPVSFGTFLGLKPFYVRSVTTKDIEMCVVIIRTLKRYHSNTLLLCHEFSPGPLSQSYGILG